MSVTELNDIESVTTVRSRGDGGFELQTRDGTLTPDVMRVLSEEGFTIEPSPDGSFVVCEDVDKSTLGITPEMWAEIIDQYEYLDELLDNPSQFASAAMKVAESDKFEMDTIEEAGEFFEDAHAAWEILVDILPDDLVPIIRDFSQDLDNVDNEELFKAIDGDARFAIINIDELESRKPDVTIPESGTKNRLVLDTVAEHGPLTSGEAAEVSGYENAGGTLSGLKGRGLVEVVDESTPYTYDIPDDVRSVLEAVRRSA